MAKFNLDDDATKGTLLYTLTAILKMLHPFMPYVTDAIYESLPIKDENIMISEYPIVDKNLIFVDEERNINEVIEFIKYYRNTIKENNISGKYSVLVNFDNNIVFKILKLQDKIVHEALDITAFKVNTPNFAATIYYEKEITEEDVMLKEKQIQELKASIEKREKLLNNEAFVSKAPAALVEKERIKLAEEKEELSKLTE